MIRPVHKQASLGACLALLLAAPASAFELTQSGGVGFGVIHERDRETGERHLRPGTSAELNFQLGRQLDSGVRLQFNFGIEADSLGRRHHGWAEDGAHPGLHPRPRR